MAGRWECPWHQCDICGKEAASFCEMCPSSYCLLHREGLLFISKLDGKLSCSEHDPCGPDPLEPGEIREYAPQTRTLPSGLGMAVIPPGPPQPAGGPDLAVRKAQGVGAGAAESFPAFSIPVPITIPVAAPAASPPPSSSHPPGSPRPHVYDLPHYSPISSYEEERDVLEEDEDELLAEEEEDEEEELVEEEGEQKSDDEEEEEDDEDEEVGLEYLELKDDEDEEEEEE